MNNRIAFLYNNSLGNYTKTVVCIIMNNRIAFLYNNSLGNYTKTVVCIIRSLVRGEVKERHAIISYVFWDGEMIAGI